MANITSVVDQRYTQDLAYFKEILGESVLSSINDGFHLALQNPTCISKQADNLYKVQWDQMIDVSGVDQTIKANIFMENSYNPTLHLMACLVPMKDIEIVKCETINLSLSTRVYTTCQNLCCTPSGWMLVLTCCFIPLLCAPSYYRCKPNHINIVVTVFFRHTNVMGVPVVNII